MLRVWREAASSAWPAPDDWPIKRVLRARVTTNPEKSGPSPHEGVNTGVLGYIALHV